MNFDENNKKLNIVSIIVILRLILSPIFFYLIIYDYTIPAILILLIVIFTDYLDGFLVKKLNLKPIFSFYLDPVSDFIFIFLSFSAFIIKGIYPVIVLFVLIFMFIQFVFTSGFENPVYDPVGKYYGIFIFFVIGITLFLEKNNYNIIFILIILVSLLSLASRIIFFNNKKIK